MVFWVSFQLACLQKFQYNLFITGKGLTILPKKLWKNFYRSPLFPYISSLGLNVILGYILACIPPEVLV